MTQLSVREQILALAGWIGISFTAAAVGGLASVKAAGFYQKLSLPVWAPPSWLFGPAWTLLYLLMGIAAWIVWKTGGRRNAAGALFLFLVQLAANALWTWLFFAWRLGAAAFIEIILLWILILCTLIAFWRIRPLAGYLLLPYLFWVSFAAALTFSIWQRNPQLLG